MPKQKRTKKLDSSLEFGDIFEGLQAVLRRFLRDEAIGGKLLVAGALIALVIFNSPWQAAYAHFWEVPVRIGFGDFGLRLDIRHWINEGLMTIFFLVVGFEIKKEIVYGALKHPKVAILPVGAALAACSCQPSSTWRSTQGETRLAAGAFLWPPILPLLLPF